MPRRTGAPRDSRRSADTAGLRAAPGGRRRPPANSARWRPVRPRPGARRARCPAAVQKSRSTAYALSCMICDMAYRAAVAGASGYAGAELLRLLAGHPEIEVVHVTADSNAGGRVADLYPSLAPVYGDLTYAPLEVAGLRGLDLVFCALPHGASQALAADLLDDVSHVVDLGA